ncbi:hypothetical protein RP20_CCG008159 [Aedes albopictus]|nr:uncharacterized protein LOC109426626 [Aedes albopictus]KXJ77188.1 hypothetical protein RP20_CCG008159 [Aedes albopictus]
MFAKVFVVTLCLLVTAVSAKPHVLTPAVVGPAFVTAQSSQVFARTYNGIVPVAVAAAPAAVVPPHYHVHAVPSYAPFYVQQAPAVFSYAVYAPAPAVATAVPAIPATPAVVATPAAAKVVAAAPVAKVVAAPVRTAPYLTTIRYRSVVV